MTLYVIDDTIMYSQHAPNSFTYIAIHLLDIPSTSRRVVYRTHVSIGRSFDYSFHPTITIFALFHLMPRRFFLQILGAHFQSNSLKTQATATFFLHPLLFTKVDAVSWLKLWHVEFSQRHCHARTCVWKC